MSFTNLRGFRIRASDEPEGSVDDFYFDDESWTVRYLVAGLGFWIFGRQGLIAVDLVGKPDLHTREVPVSLTAEEIKDSPRAEADAPVSEQQDRIARRGYSVWPPYLLGPAGAGYTPMLAEQQVREAMRREVEGAAERLERGDPHLRSMNEVIGYDIAATDGEIGSVSDFLVNPLDWRVRYYVIDTGRWLPGRRVVLATEWTTRIDWNESDVVVDVPKHRIETSPEIEDLDNLSRSTEERLYRHYNSVFPW